MVFAELKSAGRAVAQPSLTYGTMDHIIDTLPGRADDTMMKGGRNFIEKFRAGAKEMTSVCSIAVNPARAFRMSRRQSRLALPGSTLVCCDSHTGTVGGVGVLAWGIGSSEGEHVMATQTLVRTRPKMTRVEFTGTLGCGVTAKDMILGLIGKYGATGGDGHALDLPGRPFAGWILKGDSRSATWRWSSVPGRVSLRPTRRPFNGFPAERFHRRPDSGRLRSTSGSR